MKAVNLIYFSPTGTSAKIVKAIGQEFGASQVKEFDITPPEFIKSEDVLIENDLTIIGIPVYKGRLPQETLLRLKKFTAKNAPVVLVVVYGNRAFEDALIELKDIAMQIGFTPLAASAFIGEHSFSNDDNPIAKNRPDEDDLQKARSFAKDIFNKLADGISSLEDLQVPGNYPYKEILDAPVIAPITLSENCTLCGICGEVCPVDAIEVNKRVITNAASCIWCCACVKSCPEEVRIFNDPIIQNSREKLMNNCSEPKEVEFFI